MTSESLEALIATIPQYAVMIYLIIRQEGMIRALTEALIANNKILLDLHPPQSESGAASIVKKASKTPPETAS